MENAELSHALQLALRDREPSAAFDAVMARDPDRLSDCQQWDRNEKLLQIVMYLSRRRVDLPIAGFHDVVGEA